MEKLDVVNAALAALRAGETCELVVVAGTAGSSPRGVGAWMAVFADGSQAGTIGGGKIELVPDHVVARRPGEHGEVITFANWAGHQFDFVDVG